MSRFARNGRGVLYAAASAAAVILVVASVEAERPIESGRAASSLSPAEVLESLGPGPLPPHRAQVGRSGYRPKATAVEDGIDRCVESDMARLNAPGAAVAVILDGQLLYESGYGVKRRGDNSRVDADTIFRIGSVTKMMTAAAVMQQVELGRVDLDEPVTTYIPEFEIGGRWPSERMRVRHTLTHSTGFPDRITHTSVSGPLALSVWAADQGAIELHAPPGSFWNYSNPNFMLAGLVAERASGTPYRQLFKESLWEPAGMYSTTFSPSEVVDSGNYSYGHYDAGTGNEIVVDTNDYDLWVGGPAGFAFSTVGDLTRWALLLMDGGGAVLSPWSAATMQDRHQWMHYTDNLFYGYGVMIEEYEGLDVRQHGGNVAGYGTYLLWIPERRFAVALLANVTYSLTQAAYCIVDEVLDPTPVDPPDLTTDPSTWVSYLGDYVFIDNLGASTNSSVYFEGGLLMASIVDPDSGETFYTRLQQVFLDTFLYDSNGNGRIDNEDGEVTFCSNRGQPGFMMWLRNRYSVGERQLTPRSGGSRRP